MQHWTPEQWAAFTLVTGIGLCAIAAITAAVRAVRGWTAPAPLRRTQAPMPRPTLARAADRAALDAHWRIDSLNAEARERHNAALTGEYTVIDPGLEVDPQSDAGTAAIEAGPAAIAAVEPDGGLLTSSERLELEAAWINAGTADLEAALERALADFRAAVEPAMRKARAWELRGEEGHGAAPSARVALAHWRIDTPTGEYPLVRPRDVASALLVS